MRRFDHGLWRTHQQGLPQTPLGLPGFPNYPSGFTSITLMSSLRIETWFWSTLSWTVLSAIQLSNIDTSTRDKGPSHAYVHIPHNVGCGLPLVWLSGLVNLWSTSSANACKARSSTLVHSSHLPPYRNNYWRQQLRDTVCIVRDADRSNLRKLVLGKVLQHVEIL